VFETLDTNQDGTVSAEELAAANTDDASGTGAASSLIKTADQDGDGSLSGGEFYSLLDEGEATGTDSTLASLMSGSTAAADLMQKLLAQLDTALASSSGSTSTANSGVSVTA
jgi:Ca2+-binding EF-hand superfamily protein